MDYEKILSRTAQEIKPSGIRKFFDLIGSMNCHVNLIPVNPVRERSYTAPDRTTVLKFKNIQNVHKNIF